MKLSMVKEMIFLLKDRQKLPLVMGMYFLLSLLDLLGIGLIIPFFGMLLDENGVWSDMLMAYASPYFLSRRDQPDHPGWSDDHPDSSVKAVHLQ